MLFLDLNNINIEDDVLVYQDLNQPHGMISDWFGMGTTNTMNVFVEYIIILVN